MSKITITLDASQLRAYMTCPNLWVYAYVERLRFHREQRIYLDKGTFIHKLLEIFYTLRALKPNEERAAHAQAVIELVKAGKLSENNGLTKEDKTFIVERFMQYVIRWTSFDFVPLVIDDVPAVEIGFAKVLSETDDWLFVVEGKIDLLTKLPNGVPCFVDNKTQEKISILYPYKVQFLTYAWATGYEYGMYNYFRLAQKYEPETTFKHDLYHYPERVVREWEWKMFKIFREIYDVMKRVGAYDVEHLRAYNFERNENSCGGAHEARPCNFVKICEEPCQLHNAIKQTQYTIGKKWTPWD